MKPEQKPGNHLGVQKGGEVVALRRRGQINASAEAKRAKKPSLVSSLPFWRDEKEVLYFILGVFSSSKSRPQRGSQMSSLKRCKKLSKDLQNSGSGKYVTLTLIWSSSAYFLSHLKEHMEPKF